MSEIFRVYLAGPCKYEEDEGKGWRIKATQMLKTATEDRDVKIKVLNPVDFFSYEEHKHQSDTQVKKYYLDQILHSRLVLVNLTRTNTSPGTSQELQYAVDHNIPIIGYTTENEEVYPWLKVDCQVVFQSLLQAIDYIVDYYLS